jgi:hypothetical protein
MSSSLTSRIRNKELEIESSKPILNENDLELIILYLESERRSNCGFNIENYRLLDKYHIKVEFEKAKDKLTLLERFEKQDLEELLIKNFNLTINLPLKDLISKQEDKYKHNNQTLTLYNLSDAPKNDQEYLEQFVDAFTSDTDGCEHESIEFSKIFDSCVYIKYNMNFNREEVDSRYRTSANLTSNCNFLFAYEGLNYLVLKTKNDENIIDIVDKLKQNFNFKSVRPVDKLLLLEFKSTNEMTKFKDEKTNEYFLEMINNLDLLHSCEPSNND